MPDDFLTDLLADSILYPLKQVFLAATGFLYLHLRYRPRQARRVLQRYGGHYAAAGAVVATQALRILLVGLLVGFWALIGLSVWRHGLHL